MRVRPPLGVFSQCCRAFAAAALSLLLVSLAEAAPTITKLSLRGLQAGGTTRLAIDGNELGPQTRVLLGAHAPAQQVQAGATPQHVEVDLTLDAHTPAGVYLLRVASDLGISQSVPLSVDSLPQAAFAPQITSLPTSMTGSLGGATVLRTSFAGKKGQPIVVDVQCRRLGANVSPIAHLLDARRVQIAWGRGQVALGGDSRLEAVLPADGEYFVELHDALYRGGEPNHFCLKIGELKYADLAFPLGVQLGTKSKLGFLSTNLPQSVTADDAATAVGLQAAAWPAGVQLLTGLRPQLVVTSHAELVETTPAAGQIQELPAAPVGVSGKLAAPSELDRYKLPVTPGQALRIDVLASRAGSPVDGVLSVLNEAGGQLAASDDRPGTSDPGLDFTVPADVKAIVLALRDMRGAGSANHAYRISVTPLAAPDFALSMADERILIPQGGVALVRVRAARQSYAGPIKLNLPGLPAGITATNAEIPAGASDALVTFAAPGASPAQAVLTIAGDAADGAVAVHRELLLDETPVTKLQPWLRGEVAVAVTPAGPLVVNWDGIAADAKLVAGAPIASQVKVARAAGTSGAVRLVLVTTQQIPKKTIKVNNQDQQVDDMDKAVRIDGAPTIAADAGETPLNLLVPADLPSGVYDLGVRAELLSADGKTVVASAVSTSKRLAVQPK